MRIQIYKSLATSGYKGRTNDASRHGLSAVSVGKQDFVTFSGHRKHGPKYSRLIQHTPNSPVSHRFKKEVDEAIHDFPDYIQQALYQTNFRFLIGAFLTDIFPDLKGQHPRGWVESKTWEHVDAVTSVKLKKIGVAEYKIKEEEVVPSGRAKKMIRHEAGHAVDVALGDFSQTDKGFKDAYWQDFQNYESLSKADQRRFKYYIQAVDGQPSKAGMQETFAEAFASVYGGGCRDNFKQYFPHTCRYVEFAMDKKRFNSHLVKD